MAYDRRNINTLDLRKSTGVGVSIPFSNPSVFASVYTTKDQIKYNLLNYILTDPKERVFNPRFGLGLRSRLFEQISLNTADEIKLSIKAGIEQYFPNVIIENLNIVSDTNNYLLTVQIKYSIKNIKASDEILLNFNVNA